MSMDRGRSHVQGLLPYVASDGVKYVEENTGSGNWGKYVCDFGVAGTEDDELCVAYTNGVRQEPAYYKRYRYADLTRNYNYARKQIRDGIILKKVRKEIPTATDCDGQPSEYKEMDVWTDKFKDTVEKYQYEPFNYYGEQRLDDDGNELEVGYRRIPNFTKYGEYGYVLSMKSDATGNQSRSTKDEMPESDFILLVGICKDGDGMLHSNENITYNRWKLLKENPDLTSEELDEKYYSVDRMKLDWEYPDAAGRIKNDAEAWHEFGFPGATNTGTWGLCKDMENNFIGVLIVPEIYDGEELDGDKVPDKIAYADIPEWIEWFETHTDTSCCYEKKKTDDGEGEVSTIVDREWEKMGGDVMKKFVNANKNLLSEMLNKIKGYGTYLVPEMDLTILFTNEYRDSGYFSVYEDGTETEFNGYYTNVDGSKYPDTKIEAHWEDTSDKELLVESQLYQCRSDEYYSDDEGVLPGIFDIDGGYYKCRYRNYWEYESMTSVTDTQKEKAKEYEEVPATASTKFDDEIIKIPKDDSEDEEWTYYREYNKEYIEVFGIGAPTECHDDYIAANNDSAYFTATIVEEAIPILKKLVPEKEGRNLVDLDFVNLLAKFKSPLKIPYIVGEVHNFYEPEDGGRCYGDYVTAIEYEGELIKITYNIGGKCNADGSADMSSPKRGVLLQDTYGYHDSNTYNYTCSFDGFTTEVPCDYIDTGTTAVVAESEDLGSVVTDDEGNKTFKPKKRYCSQAKVLGIYVNAMFTGAKKTILFKRGFEDGISFTPESEVDISLNRGSAAAFESYFKLGECNTFEDLQNYQNNYFELS